MSKRQISPGENVLRQRAVEVGADAQLLEAVEFLQAVCMEYLTATGGNQAASFLALMRQALEAIRNEADACAAIARIKRAVREQPTLMRVVSPPFPFSADGNGAMCQGIYVTPYGSRQLAHQQVLIIPDDLEAPELFAPILTDAEGKVYLGVAPQQPVQQLAEAPVLAVEDECPLPDLAQVRVKDETNQAPLLFASPDLAQDIAEHLQSGEEVIARHDHLWIHKIVFRPLSQDEPFVEHLPAEGLTLDDLILPQSIKADFYEDMENWLDGNEVRVLLVGPTGVGKTGGVEAAARTNGRRANKEVVRINISSSTVGSKWYTETEQLIRRARDAASNYARKGYLVQINLDELDQLVSAADGRHESVVDHRVRLTIQEMLNRPLPPLVAVYATMNNLRGNLLHGPVRDRFLIREYPRPTRRQMACLGEKFVSDAVAAQLSLTRPQFGQRVGHFLFSEEFVVAQLHLHSGAIVPIRARDLHRACPRVLKMHIERFSSKVCRETAHSLSLEDLFESLEKDLHAVHLTKHSFLDNTYVKVPSDDPVASLERLQPGEASLAPSNLAS